MHGELAALRAELQAERVARRHEAEQAEAERQRLEQHADASARAAKSSMEELRTRMAAKKRRTEEGTAK